LKDCIQKADTNGIKLTLDKENSSNSLIIKMQSKLAGAVKFFWQFELEKLDNKYIKEFLVVPLLLNHSELQSREDELVKIIQNKDKEIEDFKSQGVKLTRGLINFFFIF
jgi:hypothetical protein